MSAIATKFLASINSPGKRTRRLILCMFALVLAVPPGTSPVLADRLSPASIREHLPKSRSETTAHPTRKSFRLSGEGSSEETSTSSQKFGMGVFLTYLAALLASILMTLPRPGGKQTQASRLQTFAAALTLSATLILAVTGCTIALADAGWVAFDQTQQAINTHLPAILLLALGFALTLATRAFHQAPALHDIAPSERPVPLWPAAITITAVSASGLMLALPFVFTATNGEQFVAIAHALAGVAFTALVAARPLRNICRSLAARPRPMPKIQPLVQRRTC